MPNTLSLRTLRHHLTNALHHINTKALTNAFFPAFGTALGYTLPIAVAVRLVLF